MYHQCAQYLGNTSIESGLSHNWLAKGGNMSGKNEPCNHPAHSKSVDGNVSTLYPGFFSHTVGNVLSRNPVCKS